MTTMENPTIDVSGTTFAAARELVADGTSDEIDANDNGHESRDRPTAPFTTAVVAKGKSYLAYLFLGVCSSVLYLPPAADNTSILFENLRGGKEGEDEATHNFEVVPMALELCYHKPLRAVDFQWATTTFIGKNRVTNDSNGNATADEDEFKKRLQVQIKKFNELYRDVKVGDRYLLQYIPYGGISLFLNGECLGTVGQIGGRHESNDVTDNDDNDGEQALELRSIYEQQQLAKTIYSIWFGEYAFSESMKNELLTPLHPPVEVPPEMMNTQGSGEAVEGQDDGEKHEGKSQSSFGILQNLRILLEESTNNAYPSTPSSTLPSSDRSQPLQIPQPPSLSSTSMTLSTDPSPTSSHWNTFQNNFNFSWIRRRSGEDGRTVSKKSGEISGEGDITNLNPTAAKGNIDTTADELNSFLKQLFQESANADPTTNRNEINYKNILLGIGGTLFLLPHLAVLLSLPPVLRRRGAPYLPTLTERSNVMFDLIRKSQIQNQNIGRRIGNRDSIISHDSKSELVNIGAESQSKNLKFVDIGSGDGRVVFRAAREGTFDVSVGYEINPTLHLFAQFRRLVTPKYWSTTRFYCRDLWNTPLNNYNVVTVYGLAPIMDRLGRKLEGELKPGSIVVSNVFPFPKWRSCTDVGNVYLYRIPDCYRENEK